MKILKSTDISPPGGWRYKDPDTGFDYNQAYSSFSDLAAHVVRYRAQNKLDPIPDLPNILSQWLCAQPNMERYCKNVFTKRTVGQYVRGLGAAAKMAGASKKIYAPQEVAEKRAAICVNCEYNKPSEDDSKARHYTDEYVQKIVGNRRTALDGKLFSCEICTCPLRSKVHISQKIVEESVTVSERYKLPSGLPGLDGDPIYCWQINPIK